MHAGAEKNKADHGGRDGPLRLEEEDEATLQHHGGQQDYKAPRDAEDSI
jgi:hypothetical protein